MVAPYEGKMDGDIITDIISSITVVLDSSGWREIEEFDESISHRRLWGSNRPGGNYEFQQ